MPTTNSATESLTRFVAEALDGDDGVDVGGEVDEGGQRQHRTDQQCQPAPAQLAATPLPDGCAPS